MTRDFMDEVFPDHRPLSRAWRMARPSPSSAAMPEYPEGLRIPHSLLGQAIGRVGVYLSRYGALVTWNVDEFLTLLGADTPLGDLRPLLSERFEPQRRKKEENWQALFASLPPDLAENLRSRRAGHRD
ncbi:hypothetical protein [Halostreptopolyspora alba]|uniref:Uncharacterized protein n=1 Tax=Halostreptopolyspora alba TaxID=2487137 RepID=A0A3N0EGL8_9ACTN|nr:hypothetical protein EFW17_03365 [Nocardiopsaceae bacterium YIM 96095]